MTCALEIEYKKDLRNNYMVIEKNINTEYSSFCIKLLERQKIDGLLSVEQKQIDDRSLLYYSITGKQAINNILEKTTLSNKGVKSLCSGIICAIERAYEYLLPENDFILIPDYIYQDITTGDPYLCLYPGYNIDIKEQISSLMEFLMNKVDYTDKEAVYLVYRLYAVSKEDGYTLEHLKEVIFSKDKNLSESRDSTFSREGTYSSDGRNTESRNREGKNKESNSDNGFRLDTSKNTLIDRTIKATISTSINTSKNTPIDKNSIRVEELPLQKGLANSTKESNIPVVLEKVEGEKEITCYSILTYLIALGCVLAGVVIIAMSIGSKIIYNSLGTRIDYSKLVALIVILGCVEGYLMSKLFDKKNRITRIVKTKEYIDPRIDYYDNDFEHEALSKNTHGAQALSESFYSSKDIRYKDNEELEESSPTCLLNEQTPNESMPVLKAIDLLCYKDITITSLPFFIGKLKKNVDYCLDKETVSRYHAKITKEGEAFYLTDLNSTNGTFINDEPIPTYQKREIRPGDIIAFANIKYQFVI